MEGSELTAVDDILAMGKDCRANGVSGSLGINMVARGSLSEERGKIVKMDI